MVWYLPYIREGKREGREGKREGREG